MPEAEIGNAVQLLDLMLEFFTDDAHWTRGRYDDGNGGHCLVGALLHLSREHRLPSAPVIALLQDAMPRPGSRLCTSTTIVAAPWPSCARSSSRRAVSRTIPRSESGPPPRSRPGCSPRSRKNELQRRRQIPENRCPSDRSPANASPPSHRPQPSPKAALAEKRKGDVGWCFGLIGHAIGLVRRLLPLTAIRLVSVHHHSLI